MGKFNEELVKAGVMLAAEAAADFQGQTRKVLRRQAHVIDGPLLRPRN